MPGGYVRSAPKKAETRPRPVDANPVGKSATGASHDDCAPTEGASDKSGGKPNFGEDEPFETAHEQHPKESTEALATDGEDESVEAAQEPCSEDQKEESSEAISFFHRDKASGKVTKRIAANSMEAKTRDETVKELAKVGGHPLMIIEYQRLELKKTHEDAELVLPEGLYWEPTKPAPGDPFPLMEMIAPKPGEHYDNIIHVWHLPLGGELIGRPVERSLLKMKGPDGKPLYGPEIDEDTDKNGWSYSTKFENMDQPREGGRNKRRFTDVVRSRCWKFGNEMPTLASC